MGQDGAPTQEEIQAIVAEYLVAFQIIRTSVGLDNSVLTSENGEYTKELADETVAAVRQLISDIPASLTTDEARIQHIVDQVLPRVLADENLPQELKDRFQTEEGKMELAATINATGSIVGQLNQVFGIESDAAPDVGPQGTPQTTTGYTADQVTAVENALKLLVPDPSVVSNLTQQETHAAIADITSAANQIVQGFNVSSTYDVKDINEKLEAGVQSARDSWDDLSDDLKAEFEGGFDGFFAKIIERRFPGLDPAVHTPELIMNYARAMEGLQAAGVFDPPEGSEQPAVEVRNYTPDAATTQAMTYIRENVFPKLGVSAGTSVADFRTNFTGAATELATMLNLQGDPSTYPDQVRTKLDELANHSGLQGIRSTYETMLPLGEDRAKAAVRELIRGLDSEMFGRLPQAMQDDPSLIFEVIDQKAQISTAVAQIYSSGVLDNPEVVVTTPTPSVVQSGGDGGAEAPTAGEVTLAATQLEMFLSQMDGKLDTAAGLDYTSPTSFDGSFDDADKAAMATALQALRKLNGEENPTGAFTTEIGEQIAVGILTKDAFSDVRAGLQPPITGDYTVDANGMVDIGGGQKVSVLSEEFLNSSLVEANGDKAAVHNLQTLIHQMDVMQRAGQLTAAASEDDPDTGPDTGPDTTNGAPTQAQVDAASVVVENLLIQLGGAMENMGGGLVSQLAGYTAPESADGNFDAADQDAFHMAIMGLKKLMGEENPDGTYNAAVGRQIAEAMLGNKLGMVESQLPVQINGEYEIQNGQVVVGNQRINVYNTDPSKPNQYFSDEFLNSEIVAANGDKAALEQFGHVIHSMDILARAEKLANERARDVSFMGTMMERIGQFLPDSIKSWLQDFFENDQFGQMIGGLLTAFGFPVHKLWGGEEQGLQEVRPQVEQYYRTELEAAGFDHAELKSRIMSRMDDSAAFKAVERLLFTGDETGLMRRSVEEALDAAALHAGDPDKAAEVFANHLIQAGEAFQGRQLTPENREEYFQTIRRAYEEEVRTMEGVPQDDASAGGPAAITAAGQRDVQGGPEINPSDLTSVAADAETAGNDGQFELVFTHNTTDYVQGPTRFSNGRVEILQSIMAQNSDALEMSTRPDAYMRSGGEAPDMMTRNTAMALEELAIRAQLAKGVEIDNLSHDYNDATITAVQEYMRDKGVAEDDITRFTETVRDLQSDMKSTVSGNPTAGEAQEHSVWAQSYIANQVGVRASMVPVVEREEALEDAGPEADTDRYPGIKMSDDNELPPGMTIEDVFERYKDFNAPKGDPNCAPLVFEHEGKAYAAVVIEATNTFTVQELDGYLDKPEGLDSMNREEMLAALEGSKYQALSTSDYNLLHDNYNWRDGSRFGIQNYVNRMLCLDPLVIPPAPEAERTGPEAETGLGPEFRRSHDGDGAIPTNYWDLPRLGAEQLNGLDGGHMDMRELNRLYDYSVTSRHIPNGGAMLTRLGAEDAERLGGDMIISVRNRSTNEIEHRLVNFEEHKIKIGNLTETFDPDASIRRLDDFLNTGYNQMSSVVLSNRMGGQLIPAYIAEYRYGVNDGLRELYGRPGGMDSPAGYALDTNTNSLWHRHETEYLRGNSGGEGYNTRLMRRGEEYVAGHTARVVHTAGSPHREEFGHRCGQPQTERVIDDPRHVPGVWGSGINTITDIARVIDFKTGGGREIEIEENTRDCGAHIRADQQYFVYGYEPVVMSGDPTPGVVDPPR